MERILLHTRVESPFRKQRFSFAERDVIFASHFYEMEEINGFVVYQQPLYVFDSVGRTAGAFIFLIRPNKSSRWFAFRRYCEAVDFCRTYINAHSDRFWFKNWSTLHSVLNVTHICTELIPYVAFTHHDDDLPF